MTHPSPDHLGAYLDGELDADARAAVDAHLDACAECGAHLADLAAVDDSARDVPLVVPAGYFDDFAPRVRARLETRAPARWRPPVWGWAAAAALLLGVITPLALRERRAPSVHYQSNESTYPAAPAAGAPASGVGAKQDSEPEAAADAPSSLAAPPRQPMLEKRADAYASPAPPTTSPVRPEPRTLDEAAKSSVAGRDEDARANASFADRLTRRDGATRNEGAAAGGSAPGSPPSTQAAPAEERAKRELDGAAETKLQREEFAQAEPQRTAGYAAPPTVAPAPAAATGQRQHGPRSQNTVEAPPPPPAPKAVEPSKDKETTQFASETGRLGATAQESVTVTQESQALARGRESMKFRTLRRAVPRSDAEARALREGWRTFAAEHPDLPETDEARVQLVEAGALAYRLGRKPQDREVALRDGRSYLERPQAPQAERVRALLKTLEPAGAP